MRVREPVRAWAASALLIPLPADSFMFLPEFLQSDIISDADVNVPTFTCVIFCIKCIYWLNKK